MTSPSIRTDAGYRGPPWTTRCPIAAIPSIARTALASRVSSSLPSATSNSWSKRTRSSSSTRLSLRELDPALRTSTRNLLLRPGPIEDLRRVLAVAPGVLPGAQPEIDHLLTHVGGPRTERRHAADHVHHQVVGVDIAQHGHSRRCGCRALVVVATDVNGDVV